MSKHKTQYQPKTGARCTCKPGMQRDNCSICEGTGMVIDFAAIRARKYPQKPPVSWYGKTTNSGSAHEQGLVIDENSGANIAVTYDPKHAPLIAAAPDLLAACLAIRDGWDKNITEPMALINAAISKATTNER